MWTKDLLRPESPETEVASDDGGDQSYKEVATETTRMEDDINDKDVYCGRDKRSHIHPGNKRFRKLITEHRESYQTAVLREEKTRITAQIIEIVHKYGGRFMKSDEKSGKWFEVSEAYAHDKVSHALRSAKDPHRIRVPRKRVQKEDQPTKAEDEALRRLLMTQEKLYSDLISKQKAIIC